MSIADLAKLIIILIIFTLPEYSPRLVKVEKFEEEEVLHKEEIPEEEQEEVPKKLQPEPKKGKPKEEVPKEKVQLKPPIRELQLPTPKPIEERIVEVPRQREEEPIRKEIVEIEELQLPALKLPIEERIVEVPRQREEEPIREEIAEIERIPLIVFDLEGDDGGEVTSWLIKSLLKTNRFNVLRMPPSAYRGEDAELAISGRVSKGVLWSVELTLIRLPGEVVVLMDTIQGTRGEIKVWIESFVENVLLKFPPLRGRIIEKGKDSFTMDLGAKDGVMVGMKFSVYRLIGLRRHPVSARIMGLKFQDVGIIEVTDVWKATSEVEIVRLLPGKRIKIGDFVCK